MASPQKVFQGQSIYGTINLRKTDPNTSAQSPYALAEDDVIQVKFPGLTPTAGSVSLSTANAGEITVTDPVASQFTFVCPPAKSEIIATGVCSVDVYVTHTDGNEDIFEQMKVYNVVAPANP